jgi:hypothetical protein
MLARPADGDHAGVTLLAAGGLIRFVEQVVHALTARPRDGGDPGLVMRIVPAAVCIPACWESPRARKENPGMSGKKGTRHCISIHEHSENGAALPVSGALV